MLSVFLFCAVHFDVHKGDVSEGDGGVTLEVKKFEKIDFDFDVMICYYSCSFDS